MSSVSGRITFRGIAAFFLGFSLALGGRSNFSANSNLQA
jgi:hypothetical protein